LAGPAVELAVESLVEEAVEPAVEEAVEEEARPAGLPAEEGEGEGPPGQPVQPVQPLRAAQGAQVPEPPSFGERLGKTRGLLRGYLRSIRARSFVDQSTWDELEEALLLTDVGLETTRALLETLKEKVRQGEVREPEGLGRLLALELLGLLGKPPEPLLARAAEGPSVWLFVGVNGVGKTTTIGKLARAEAALGHKVVLAAGDTFRAAAADQLAIWAERSGADLVRGMEGGDPSAVVYDALEKAVARGYDLVLADTAGRLHTKVNLLEELKKIRRVADRPPGRVTEVLLVMDATTGQNGLVQARQFAAAVGVTGIVLTKLDGTAKGGIVVAIERELGLPVKLVGLGEGPDDLVPFDPEAFVDALVGEQPG